MCFILVFLLNIKVVIGNSSGQIKVINENVSFSNSFNGHFNSILRIKQSPFNLNVATCSYDRTVIIWKPSLNWTLIRTYTNHSAVVFAIEWLDIDTLASGSSDQTVQIWSIKSGQTKRTINTESIVKTLKLLNKNNFHLAAGLTNGNINIYNINDGNLSSSLKGHTSIVYDLVQISADLLASSSDDKTVRIWNLTTNTCKFILTGHTFTVHALKQITSDLLASASSDSNIKIWNTTLGKEIRTLKGHTSVIQYSLDLIKSHNGQTSTLISGSLDKTIKLWNWSTGECLKTIQTNSGIDSLATINYGMFSFHLILLSLSDI
jgi:WD40 repeat protein